MKHFNKVVLCSVAFLFLTISCGLLSSNNDDGPEYPEWLLFNAEINGVPFQAAPPELRERMASATMTLQGEKEFDFLTIFGLEYDEEFYPYNQYIGFGIVYDPNTETYSTKKKYIDESGRFIRGSYSENDGDAGISVYEEIENGDGFITVKIEDLDLPVTVPFGADTETFTKKISGTFEMTVARQNAPNPSNRQPDTLYITNGEYKLLLRDRRNE